MKEPRSSKKDDKQYRCIILQPVVLPLNTTAWGNPVPVSCNAQSFIRQLRDLCLKLYRQLTDQTSLKKH